MHKGPGESTAIKYSKLDGTVPMLVQPAGQEVQMVTAFKDRN